jgi:hypothetical protein
MAGFWCWGPVRRIIVAARRCVAVSKDGGGFMINGGIGEACA